MASNPSCLLPMFEIAQEQCNLSRKLIQDVYATSPMQQGLVALSMKGNSSYIAQWVFELAPQLDIEQFKDAWNSVVAITPSLRTRFFVSPEHGTLQTVVRESAAWSESDNLPAYLYKDKELGMTIGDRSVRLAIVSEPNASYFVLTAHHATYDGHSIKRVLKMVEQAYSGHIELPTVPYKKFIQHLASFDQTTMAEYWTQALDGYTGTSFPQLPSPNHQPVASEMEVQNIAFELTTSTITSASLIRAAWGLLVANYTNPGEDVDVAYGSTFSGRTSSQLPAADHVIGPTMATVPIRVQISRQQSVMDLMKQVQDFYIASLPHEQFGLPRIRSLSPAAANACDFQSLLVIQGTNIDKELQSDIWSRDNASMAPMNLTQALVLEMTPIERGYEAKVQFDAHVIDRRQVRLVLAHLEQTISQLVLGTLNESMLISDIQFISRTDLNQLARWSQRIELMPGDVCLHELLAQTAASAPDSVVLVSEDLSMTQTELHRLCSKLASHLIERGLEPGGNVLICFEKSPWAIVAMLAILQTGCAIVPVDPSQPRQRISRITDQAHTTFALTSQSCAEKVKGLASHQITIDSAIIDLFDNQGLPNVTAVVDEQSPAVILFTSGSTGEPKGVTMTHGCLVSAVRAHSATMQHPKGSRIFHFSSLAFDHIVWEIFTPMFDANTICIPTETQRMNQIEIALQNFKVTAAYFTPSLAKTLDPNLLPELRTLYVGGELVPQTLIDRWANQKRLYIGYGPTEASLCTGLFANRNTKTGDIGVPINTRCWITDPFDTNTLMPIGVPGQLLCEGPMLAAGYLNNQSLTDSLFVLNPPWAPTEQGQTRRFYKTGDMVKYQSDGSIKFIGRRDRQVKLRGQRIEMQEVEHHLSLLLPHSAHVAALVIPSPGETGAQSLVAFICAQNDVEGKDVAILSKSQDLRNVAGLVHGIDDKLAQKLPLYMVPSIYIPITYMPLTSTGKVDSRILYALASNLTTEQLGTLTGESSAKIPPQGEVQLLLQRLWANILDTSPSSIGADDHFLRLGGDSISAMGLVALARRDGYTLTVQQIFQSPVLSEMAKAVVKTSGSIRSEDPLTFALVGAAKENLVSSASKAIGVFPEQIEDIYPASSLQEGMILLSLKSAGTYLSQTVFTLPEDTDVGVLKQAWAAVAEKTVIKSNPPRWQHESMRLEEYLARDKAELMTLGQPFIRFAVLTHPNSPVRHFVFTAHHAMYDGWSVQILIQRVAEAYRAIISTRSMDYVESGPSNSLRTFIASIQNSNIVAGEEFWRKQLAACPAPSFPQLPSADYIVKSDQAHESSIVLEPRDASAFTTSTLIRAAFAMVIARYSDVEDDVVFGAVLNGRSTSIPDIKDLIGPTIATVPIRVTLEDPKMPVSKLLEKIQLQATEMFPHEQFGLQNIRRLSEEARAATEFQNLLLIHALKDDDHHVRHVVESCLGKPYSVVSGADSFFTLPLTLQCNLKESKTGSTFVGSTLTFDSRVLDATQAKRLLLQFEWTLTQLWNHRSHHCLNDINLVSASDLNEIRRWNQSLPEPVKTSVHDLVAATVDRQPDEPAVASWEGELSFGQLDKLSSKIAHMLIDAGIQPQSLIPLLFEKSIWTVVTMLGVLKAGCACVSLDPSHPPDRLSGLIADVAAPVLMSSRKCQRIAQALPVRSVVVDEAELNSSKCPTTRPPALAGPEDPAFILFTSGSTGKPKGINIVHTSFASSINGHGRTLRFNTGSGSRNFQFTAYTSDVSIGEIFTSLALGSCVCVPSDAERMNDIAGAMERLKVNWTFFTPSVAALLQPETVPTLRTMVLGGETASPSLISTWSETIHLINSFGPAECSIWTHCNPRTALTDIGSNIGYGLGYSTWITEPSDYNRLAPIGVVGELCVEGPALAQGYINNPEKTAAAFVSNPGYLPKADKDRIVYRLGDLARYLPNGMVQFLGRRDTQVKLHGLRVELGEVEHQMRKCLPSRMELAVEAIRPGGNDPILATFLAIGIDPGMEDKDDGSLDRFVSTAAAKSRYVELMENMYQRPSELLPLHMVPSLILPLYKMPLSASAKTDRKKLRQLGSALTRGDLETFTSRARLHRAPQSSVEKSLHDVWVSVLKLDRDVSLDESFFHLGGDSLAAMRVVIAANSQSLRLSLADIFKTPTLRAMAKAAESPEGPVPSTMGPSAFALVAGRRAGNDVVAEAASQALVPAEQVEDLYPASPLQEGIFALSQRTPGTYLGQFSYNLAGVDVRRFKDAWELVVSRVPILRSCFVNIEGHVMQLCLKHEGIAWSEAANVEEHLVQDLNTQMGIGSPTTRFAIIHEPDRNVEVFILTAHHAIYDGWSMDLLFDTVNKAYSRQPLPPSFNFNIFIDHLVRQDQRANSSYWFKQLRNAPRSVFPVVPINYVPSRHDHVIATVPLQSRKGSDITSSTIVRAGWALVIAELAQEHDVIFGATLNGRTTPVVGLQSVIGPTFATVPVRVQLKNQSLKEFLTGVQRQATDMFDYEQFGIQNIQKISEDTRRACSFQSLLVVQTSSACILSAGGAQYYGRDKGVFSRRHEQKTTNRSFHNFAVSTEVNLADDGIFVDISYDETVLCTEQIHTALTLYKGFLEKLWTEDDRLMLSDIVTSGVVREAMAKDHTNSTTDAQTSHTDQRVQRSGFCQPPETSSQRLLHRAWSEVLSIRPDSFGIKDNFFMLGGDSIKAMALVVCLGKYKRQISVAQIFRSQELEEMANVIRETQTQQDVQPFELIHGSLIDIVEDVAAKIGTPKHLVEDAYPCTRLQEDLMAMSIKNPGSYVAQFVYSMPDTLHLARFKFAWNSFFAHSSIMRTRLVQAPSWETSTDTVQVVSRRDITWRQASCLQLYLDKDKSEAMMLGDDLARFALISAESSQHTASYFVLTLHHAVYDAVSLRNTWAFVNSVYNGEKPEELVGFNRLVKSLYEAKDDTKSKNFWISQLDTLVPSSYPRYPSLDYVPNATKAQHRKIDFEKRQSITHTTGILIRAAWSMLLQLHNDNDNVGFLAVVNGRTRSVSDITRIDGPAAATVPIHIDTSSGQTLGDFLSRIQNQILDMTAFEHDGLSVIRRYYHQAQSYDALDFRSIISIQMVEHSPDPLDVLGIVPVPSPEPLFAEFPLAVEFLVRQNSIEAQMQYDGALFSDGEAQRLLDQFEHFLTQLNNTEFSTKLSDIPKLSATEIDTIVAWNQPKSQDAPACLHELFEAQVPARADDPAVSAWDGVITYSELNDLADRMACRLAEDYGVQTEDLVPLCFEKSMWFIVSALAVLKANAAYVPLDPSYPAIRVSQILAQTEAKVIVAAEHLKEKFDGFSVPTMSVSPTTAIRLPCRRFQSGIESRASPSNLAYVLFTSGSTGVPKGVAVEHGSISTSVREHGRFMDFGSHSRTLQVSSYTFDVSVAEIFTTLSHGGCCCTPSERQRMGGIVEFINEHAVNYACFTPSYVRMLSPEVVPGLRAVVLGGEPTRQDNVDVWSQRVRLMNGYGPTEASVLAAVNDVRSTGSEASSIGRTLGAASWIVDPGDHDRLVPIGAVGELLLQGAILARGYLKDDEKTKAAFVESPAFLKDLDTHRASRMYKTGDLVRYNPDGSLAFLGRKDTQAKFNGQRLELSEIEYQARCASPALDFVAAEVVHFTESDSAAIVVFFTDGPNTDPGSIASVKPLTDELRGLAENMKAYLEKTLPAFMVPSLLMPISHVPTSTATKVDRKKLRDLAINTSLADRAVYHLSDALSVEPETDDERILQRVWSDVLHVPLEAIGQNDNFFRLGGDSLLVIKLVSRLGSEGILLTAQDAFQNATLSRMALRLKIDGDLNRTAVVPFELLDPQAVSSLKEVAMDQCHVPQEMIEDILPATALQSSLMVLSIKEPGSYLARFAFELDKEVDLQKLEMAWARVLEALPILRTRLIYSHEHGMQQVVLRGVSPIDKVNSDFTEFKKDQFTTNLGQPLCRLSTCHGKHPLTNHFVWDIHHSLYDGPSIGKVLDMVKDAYLGNEFTNCELFSSFVKHLHHVDVTESEHFWKKALANAPTSVFPSFPQLEWRSRARSSLSLTAQLANSSRSDTTVANLLRSAWAFVLANLEDTHDVVYGVTDSMRLASVPGIFGMVGPIIETFPIRCRMDPEQLVIEFLDQFQAMMVESASHSQFGIQNIRKLDDSCASACEYRTHHIVQHASQSESPDFFGMTEIPQVDTGFYTYPLVLSCTFDSEKVLINANYDEDLVKPAQMQRILNQYQSVIQQIQTCDAKSKLRNVVLLTNNDVEAFKTWNTADLSRTPLNLVPHMIQARLAIDPSAPALVSTKENLNYQEMWDWSTLLANRLLENGLESSEPVVLCFEKSVWAAVAVLAVLRAGGAFVFVDPKQPRSRRDAVIEQIEAKQACTSVLTDELISDSVKQTHIVTGSSLRDGDTSSSRLSSVKIVPHDVCYMVFTSGTTGTPKGIMLEHGATALLAELHCKLLKLGPGSRTLNFTQFVFDVSVADLLCPIIAGGCICFISEEEKMNDLAHTIQDLGCDNAVLTPTVANLLDPSSVPGLRTLALIGEPPTHRTLQLWAGTTTLWNLYGPAEATIWTSTTQLRPTSRPRDIGRGTLMNHWVVNPDDHNDLAPVGTVGELLLEGPLLARGYLKDKVKTDAAFINHPKWEHMIGRPVSRVYKTGDLVRYLEDGSLEWLSRKDTQVKLRGQRVELDDIEFHMQRVLQGRAKAYVHLVSLDQLGQGERQLLAFITDSEERGTGSDDLLDFSEPNRKQLTALVKEMEVNLPDSIPAYFIPSMYIPIRRTPIGGTEKLDRKALQTAVAQVSLEQLTSIQVKSASNERAAETMDEKFLRSLWAETLNLSSTAILADSHFLRVGGDSLAVMKLVSLVRSRDRSLTVNAVFKHPVLADMALQLTKKKAFDMEYKAFDTVKHLGNSVTLCSQLSSVCAVESDAVEDVMTCSPMQELYAEHLRRVPGSDVVQNVFKLTSTVDVTRLRKAWEAVAKATPVLRTRFVKVDSSYAQVIVNEDLIWRVFDTTRAVLDEDMANPIHMTGPMSRYALVEDFSGDRYFIWTIHHAIYDAWSMNLVLQKLQTCYNEKLDPGLATTMGTFIKFGESHNVVSTQAFWRQILTNTSSKQWYKSSEGTVQDRVVYHKTPIASHGTKAEGITPATVAYAAWALVGAKLSDSTDVCLLVTLTGRDMDFDNVEFITGPTITQVPVRFTLATDRDVLTFLHDTQNSLNEIRLHAHIGANRIARLDSHTEKAVATAQPLTVHNAAHRSKMTTPAREIGLEHTTSHALGPGLHALSLDTVASPDGMRVCAMFDNGALHEGQVCEMITMFKKAVMQLQSPDTRQRIGDISLDLVESDYEEMKVEALTAGLNLLDTERS